MVSCRWPIGAGGRPIKLCARRPVCRSGIVVRSGVVIKRWLRALPVAAHDPGLGLIRARTLITVVVFVEVVVLQPEVGRWPSGQRLLGQVAGVGHLERALGECRRLEGTLGEGPRLDGIGSLVAKPGARDGGLARGKIQGLDGISLFGDRHFQPVAGLCNLAEVLHIGFLHV